MTSFYRNSVISIILLALVIFLSEIPAFSDDTPSIIFIKGIPKIMKNGRADWEECKVGMPIGNGDRIKTLKEEATEISFLNKKSNIVRIEEYSDVFIRESRAPYSIELLNGATMAFINKLPKNSTFEIATPTGLSGARGTGWRASTNGTLSRFEAHENHIYIKGIDQTGNPMAGEYRLDSGWAIKLNKFERAEKSEKLSAEDLKRWKNWLKDLGDRLGGSENALDKAEGVGDKIDQLESKKSDIREAQDLDRLNQLERGNSGGGGKRDGTINK